MPVSVNMPSVRQKEEKDPLDTILKGLQIANGVFGIKDAIDKSRILEEQRADEKAGVLSNKDLIQYGDRYSFSDTPKDNSIAFKQRSEKGLSDLFATPKPKETDPLMAALRYEQLKNLQKRGPELPDDQKRVVSDLSSKNASKISIANQIDAVMGNWENLSDDQKVAQGRQLLKTLNSTEGADAIGTEEANRLGAKLEFAMGNLFNSNPIQFGRDLPGFAEQARGTSTAIRKAITENQKIIDDTYGRSPGLTPIGKAAASSQASSTAKVPANIQDAAKRELLRRQGIKAGLNMMKKSGG